MALLAPSSRSEASLAARAERRSSGLPGSAGGAARPASGSAPHEEQKAWPALITRTPPQYGHGSRTILAPERSISAALFTASSAILAGGPRIPDKSAAARRARRARQGLIVRARAAARERMAVICSTCGLPEDLCACGELAKDSAKIIVRLETRRFKKKGTMIEGLDPKMGNLEGVARELKARYACGGTAKEGYVFLQGDHRDTIKEALVGLGFAESAIELH